jgi:hypothetical protein
MVSRIQACRQNAKFGFEIHPTVSPGFKNQVDMPKVQRIWSKSTILNSPRGSNLTVVKLSFLKLSVQKVKLRTIHPNESKLKLFVHELEL